MQRRSIRALAREMDVSAQYLGRTINGYHPASPRVRQGLVAILGLPEEVLFRPAEVMAS